MTPHLIENVCIYYNAMYGDSQLNLFIFDVRGPIKVGRFIKVKVDKIICIKLP